MLVHSDFAGILHLGGSERMSRLEMGRRLAVYLGVDPSAIVAVPRCSVPAADHGRAMFRSIVPAGIRYCRPSHGPTGKKR